MPYTKQEDRKCFKEFEYALLLRLIKNPADLSYLITQVMKRYLANHASYWSTYSDILKALDAAREAFMEDVYRPYEREKKKENGGVF